MNEEVHAIEVSRTIGPFACDNCGRTAFAQNQDCIEWRFRATKNRYQLCVLCAREFLIAVVMAIGAI